MIHFVLCSWVCVCVSWIQVMLWFGVLFGVFEGWGGWGDGLWGGGMRAG